MPAALPEGPQIFRLTAVRHVGRRGSLLMRRLWPLLGQAVAAARASLPRRVVRLTAAAVVVTPVVSFVTTCAARCVTEEEQINSYVEELLDDDHLYHYDIIGWGRPLAVEAFIFKALVKQVVQLFKGTVGLENQDPPMVFG